MRRALAVGCRRSSLGLVLEVGASQLFGEKAKKAAQKIQKGGSGNWGTVPMAAHADISKEDAVAMVKYILLLKDEK